MENISPEEREKSLRIFHAQSACLGAYWAIAMGTSIIFTGYGVDILGMTKENAGFIGSFAFLAGAFQLFSFVFSNRVKSKKMFVVTCGLIETLLLSAALLPPLILTGKIAQQVSFVAMIFLVAVCSNVARPMLNNWLSGLIPEDRRGRYLSIRWLILNITRLIAVKLTLEYMGINNSLGGFALVFILGSLCAFASYLFVMRIHIPTEAKESDYNFRDMIKSFKHKPFKDYFLFFIVLHIGFAFACSYYAPFFLVEVGLTYPQMSYYLVAYNIMLILGMLPAGRLVDRFGARPLIYIMIIIYTIFFFMFPFFTKERLWLIVTVWGFVGLGDGLFFVAGFSALYHSIPKGQARIGSLALASGSVFLLMGIGPFVSRIYLALADNLEFTFMGERIEKFRLMFGCIGVLLFVSLFAARRIGDTHTPRIPRKYRNR
ncbi:MFS transporter [Planctomycetota bacterium]